MSNTDELSGFSRPVECQSEMKRVQGDKSPTKRWQFRDNCPHKIFHKQNDRNYIKKKNENIHPTHPTPMGAFSFFFSFFFFLIISLPNNRFYLLDKFSAFLYLTSELFDTTNFQYFVNHQQTFCWVTQQLETVFKMRATDSMNGKM